MPGQHSNDSAKHHSCEPLPRRVLDVQDADKPSKVVATGLYIDSHVGREIHKILSSKTNLCM